MFCPRSLLIAPLVLALARPAAAQDFDPRGRHHGAQPPRTTSPSHPQAGPPSHAVAPALLIERYTRIVLAQPGVSFPLQRLAQLYRDRDGRLDALVAELSARAGQPGPDQYAATVALAGVARLEGRGEDAVRGYAAAMSLRPTDPVAVIAAAELSRDRGDLASARQYFERALALQVAAAERTQTLRSLMILALDQKDWDAAGRFHRDLVKLDPGSVFVRGELGRELSTRGEYERADVELRQLVVGLAGDNRALAPALLDLGRVQAKGHQNVEALATLERALAVAGAASAVRGEIYKTITEVYRAQDALPTLVKKLEDQRPGDYARLAWLGSLYEETGDAARAIATYRRALGLEPRQVDLRVRMVRLLQAEGDLEAAIGAYEALIRSAPANPDFVFELCDALLQRGDRARALALLRSLEARAGNDEEMLGRVGEFYSRTGEADRALAVLARLAEVGGADPSHLADLGDHYFQEGNRALAVATWKRILTTVRPRARALAALGDVYLEHEMVPESLAALREAVALEPSSVPYQKALAVALERGRSYREAAAMWSKLAKTAKQAGDAALAREVRTHVVTIWTLDHVLENQVWTLATAFDDTPPDVEAGRTLAEVQLHLRRLPDAAATLRKVIRAAPGDVESYLALERVLVQAGQLGDAIGVLEALVRVDPRRARECYQRMAQYALEAHEDAAAITYAARAVELNPEDAEGHRRLGDMYRSRQDTDHAIVEYRAAIAKNERLFLVYFELADLLLARGDAEEADRLLRRVVRGTPDEELVARAARMSMQINMGAGTLASLEHDLVPLALGNPRKGVYRRLLVELYGNQTFGLMERARHGEGGERDQAKAALGKVGQRAIKPLLDALADGDGGQQRIAIDVLGYVGNPKAGPALFAFATGGAELALRVRAMTACGSLRAPELLPRYTAFLLPPGQGGVDMTPTDAVGVAAAWGVARMGDARALPLLRRLARPGNPDIRALAVLGLGLLGDRSSAPTVAALARELDAGEVARAAAVYALGDLGAEQALPVVTMLAEDGDALLRQMALLSLARLTRDKRGSPGGVRAAEVIADAFFAGGDPDSARAQATAASLRRAAVAALISLVEGGSAAARVAAAGEGALPAPEGALHLEALLGGLVPSGSSVGQRAAVVTELADVLEKAAQRALRTSAEGGRAVLAALGEGDGAIEPFVGPDADPATDAARQKVRAIVRDLEPDLRAMTRHPDVGVRIRALSLLAKSDTDIAVAALVDGTTDADESVQRFAVAALGTRPSHGTAQVVAAAIRVLARNPVWSLRVMAAEGIARLARVAPELSRVAADDLEHAAEGDGFAVVREAALRALASVDPSRAVTLAQRLVVDDPEPRVQQAARAIAHPADATSSTPEGLPGK